MSQLVERLRKQVGDDHVRGCQGRQYACSCGYDLSTEGLLETAAARIKQLEAALRIIAGYEQCIDNLMSNQDVAIAALAPEQDAGIGCGKSVIEPWNAPEQDK